MLNASESADDASADDTGSDDDSSGDGEASDASEGSGGRWGKARTLCGRSSHGILIQFDPAGRRASTGITSVVTQRGDMMHLMMAGACVCCQSGALAGNGVIQHLKVG